MGKVEANKYSWTSVANMLYIDQPAGTGFSYTTALSGYPTNETEVADGMILATCKRASCARVVVCVVCVASMLYIDQPAGTYPTNETEVADGMMLHVNERHVRECNLF